MLGKNLEETFACDAFGQMGSDVKLCQGLTCYLLVEINPERRVQACCCGGWRFNPAEHVEAAFVMVQGVLADSMRVAPGEQYRGAHGDNPK